MKNNNCGIIEIRPRIVFEKVESTFPNQDVNFVVKIPSSQIGGLFLLESSILVSLIKLINPKKIFEFGTYLGATSVLMAMNSPEETIITTLDIDKNYSLNQSGQDYDLFDAEDNDNYLRSLFLENGAVHIHRTESWIQKKIHQIYCDSKKLNLIEYDLENKFDLIFIDAGHDYESIQNDTMKALAMAKESCIIAWHDYKSNIHTEVTKFINELSKQRRIVYVQNTMMALLFTGEYQNLII